MTSRAVPARAFFDLLEVARGAFSAPGFALFSRLLTGWVLAPGRRTIAAMFIAGDPQGIRSLDAYHRFVRCGRWSIDALWRPLVLFMVGALAKDGPVVVVIDDTLFKKSGRKVEGTGIFRDTARSSIFRAVYARGLSVVIATLEVRPPWGGCPIALPISVRLHKKGGPTTVELATEIMCQLASWLPERSFDLRVDAAYASLIGRGLPRTSVTARLRRDARLFEGPPQPTGKRGRPRVRGARLESPDAMSKRLANSDFDLVEYNCRGKTVAALVWSTRALWYKVDSRRLVTVLIARDPAGVLADAFFVSDDEDATDAEILAAYAGRWAIEVTNREVKQCLGAEDPQCWKYQGPERAAHLSLWLYSAIWTWYIGTFGTEVTWTPRPWYRQKATPSFLDALAALRRTLWAERIMPLSLFRRAHDKIIDAMLDVLANAA
jgi:DDE superfamily endonuclease